MFILQSNLIQNTKTAVSSQPNILREYLSSVSNRRQGIKFQSQRKLVRHLSERVTITSELSFSRGE